MAAREVVKLLKRGSKMRVRSIIVCAIVAMSLASASSANVVGSLSTGGSGLIGSGGWDGVNDHGFKLAWDISDLGSTWHYKYIITGADGTSSLSKAISHVIIQLSDSIKDITPSDGTDEVKTYNPGDDGNSNVGLPASIYGAKITPSGDVTKWTVEFNIDREPIPGNFYAKDGKDGGVWTYVYNTGLTSAQGAFIMRPDTHGHDGPPGGPPIPTPAAACAGLVLMGAIGAARRMRKA